jgi:hypothetical protein
MVKNGFSRHCLFRGGNFKSAKGKNPKKDEATTQYFIYSGGRYLPGLGELSPCIQSTLYLWRDGIHV